MSKRMEFRDILYNGAQLGLCPDHLMKKNE